MRAARRVYRLEHALPAGYESNRYDRVNNAALRGVKERLGAVKQV